MTKDHTTGRKPSLADVAKQAGVCKASASYALRNTGKVSEETRQRVLAAARDLGYTPAATGTAPYDEHGRRHDGRVGIAWLGDGDEVDDIRCATALYRARDIGYRCAYFKAGDIDDLRSWRGSLLRGGYRGLILASAKRCLEALEVDWQSLAVVCCEAKGAEGPYTSILASDPIRELLTCYQRALAAGYKRIGCIFHDRDDELHQLRLAAANAANALHAEQLEAIPPHDCGEDPKFGIQHWARVQMPDVIIGSDPSQLYLLRRDGVRAAFICLDCPAEQEGISGTIAEPRAVGATAVNAIDQLLRFNRGGRPDLPRRITHAVRWHKGSSF